jgi:hypothetical protein
MKCNTNFDMRRHELNSLKGGPFSAFKFLTSTRSMYEPAKKFELLKINFEP